MSVRAAVLRPAGMARATWPRLRELLAALVRAADAHSTWLALLGSLTVVGALYGRALGYAFFFDDTFDLARTEERSYWQILSSSKGYQYYRPIPFLIWKALHGLQGHYDQPALHLLPLVAHAFAGWLLYVLLRRIGAGHWAALPALLFLTYPFDYQAVPIAGTLFHPLAGAAILGSLVIYERARHSAEPVRRRLHVAALGTTLIALWTHESGIVVAPLVIGLEAFLLWRAHSRRPSPWLSGHLAAALLFLIVWSSVERLPSSEHTNVGELHPKALFFLQGLTYPLSAQIGWLSDHAPFAPGILQTGLLGLAIGFGAFGVAAWRQRRWELVAIPALAVLGALAAFAPAAWRLSYSYIEDSPRLLYLVGIGAACFWGFLPKLDFGYRRVTLAWRVATCLLLVGIIVQSWRFVDVRMTMYARGTRVVDDIVALGEEYRGQRILVVNAPAWFAENRYEYLYGHFGIQLMPAYIGLERVIYTSSRTQIGLDARSASWNPEVSGGVFTFGPHGPTAPPEDLDALLRDGRELIDVRPNGNRFRISDVGHLLPARGERLSTAAGQFDSRIWITHARSVIGAEGLEVFLQWHAVQPTGGDYDTVVELRDDGGALVAGYSGYALAGFSAPRLWQAGDLIEDSLLFPTPPPGHYTIWAGLQRVHSTERMPGFLPDGTPAATGLLPIGDLTVP